jgi:hypothetical protein
LDLGHNLAGGGRGAEADRAQHSALTKGEEGQCLLGHKVVLLVLVAVVRQDGSPQVAVAADVDIGLVIPAGMLDKGGTEYRLETVEVSRAVE